MAMTPSKSAMAAAATGSPEPASKKAHSTWGNGSINRARTGSIVPGAAVLNPDETPMRKG